MPGFNLIDNPWIPVADVGRVSLMDVFTHPEYRALGGNPIQKIALMKLLLAIAQAACTPKDEAGWKALGVTGMAKSCREYLEKWRDRFDLYGERPFLQMPGIKQVVQEKHLQSFGAGFYPDVPSDNNTILSHTFIERKMDDADKALFILTLMNFSLGGKRITGGITSLAGVKLGSRYSAAAGPSQGGWNGQLHCFILTESLCESIYINMLTFQQLEGLNRWSDFGFGVPPWESMPTSESDEIANKHKKSYQSCLLAMSRFVLLEGDRLYYLDGIRYPKIEEGWYEPSLAIDTSGASPKVKYVDIDKKPWRELQSLLSFLLNSRTLGFECFLLKTGENRLRGRKCKFAAWSAGLAVSSNSGDQSVKKNNDFVESTLWLNENWLSDFPFEFEQYKSEMEELEKLGSYLYSRIKKYFSLLTDTQKKGTVSGKNKNQLVKEIPRHAANQFWQLCEREAQKLVDACSAPEETRNFELHKLRCRFVDYLQQTYNQFCPRETARQMDAWAQSRPNTGVYLAMHKGGAE